MGLTVRAAGAGKKVLLYQFLKDNQSSERKILDRIPGIRVIPTLPMTKWTFRMNKEELDRLHAQNDEMLDRLFAMAADYDMLVMDESLYAIDKGLLSEDRLIRFLEDKPYSLEVVLSGRNPSQTMIDHADYVSEICKRKHPFDRGIAARRGIEK